MAERGERATKDSNLKQGPKSPDAASGPTLSSLGISRPQASRSEPLRCDQRRSLEAVGVGWR